MATLIPTQTRTLPGCPPLRSLPLFRFSLVAFLSLFVSSFCWSDFLKETEVAPGVRHIKIVNDEGPVEADALVVDLKTPGVKLECPHADGSVLAVQPLSAQIRDINEPNHYATGGINGDFFFLRPREYAGKPIGLQVHLGEIITSPWRQGRSCFAILRDGRPVIAIPSMDAWGTKQDGSSFTINEINGPREPDSLALYTPAYGPSTQTVPPCLEAAVGNVNLPLESGKEMLGRLIGLYDNGNTPIPRDGVILSAEGSSIPMLESLQAGDELSFTAKLSPPFDEALEAVGGGPRLLRDGRISVEADEEAFAPQLATSRNPRSAVGFDDKHLYLLTIDGRQNGYSVGATLQETAQILAKLGAREGMNLDGGGSTTLIARDNLLNSPSDGSERPVANSILTICTIPKGEPNTLSITPSTLHIASGCSFAFVLTAKDRLGNPILPGQITWVLNPPSLGSLSQDGRFLAGKAAGSGLVKAFCKNSAVHAYAEVTVHEHIASVSLQPAQALLLPAEPLQLRFTAQSEQGESIAVDPQSVLWMIESGSGQIDTQGSFLSASPGVTQIAAFFRGLKATASAYVGGSVVELEDFEDTSEWSPNSYPRAVPADFRKSAAFAHSGSYSGRLLYDFDTLDVARAAYAACDLEIGSPRAISLWVYGDGSGHWLRATLKDASGQRLVVDLARPLDWKDEWREVSAALPASGPSFPLHLSSLYLVEPDPEKHGEGTVYFDDLRVLY